MAPKAKVIIAVLLVKLAIVAVAMHVVIVTVVKVYSKKHPSRFLNLVYLLKVNYLSINFPVFLPSVFKFF